MSLPLTPHMLAAAYEYLRSTPPFKAWNLPEADVVEFHITRHVDREADHTTFTITGEHRIRVSENVVGTTDTLMQALGHEMIHAAKGHAHGIAFRRAAKRACFLHGWDEKRFL